jgi:hypothetical protein
MNFKDMKNKQALWFNLPHKMKNNLTDLINKINTGGCFDTTSIENLRDNLTWFNTPNTLNKVVQILEDNRYPVNIGEIRWYKMSEELDKLNVLIENFDCLNIPDIQAPSVPQNLISSNTTSTSTKLDWDASTDDREVDYYNIYKDGNVTTTRVGNTATISGLSPSNTYQFQVSAVDTAGNESGLSAVESVTTNAI